MISEQRQILFSRPALRAALSTALHDPKLQLPPGHVLDAQPAPAGGCEVTLEGLGGTRRTLSLPPAQMAVVLIAYAKRLRIPVPRRGEKSLHGTDDGLVLSVRIATALAERSP